MKKINIESIEDLDALFKEKTLEMTDTIKNSIQQAHSAKKRTAQLFEIQINGTDSAFEISLSKAEWIVALENCLKHYEEWEHSDDAIDTYMLIKTLKDETAS